MSLKLSLSGMALTVMLLIYAAHTNAQTATWTGAFSTDWNDSNNWAWDDGSTGVPGAGNDVMYPDGTTFPIVISGNDLACNNFYFPGNEGFFGNSVYFEEGGYLNIYGNVQDINSLVYGEFYNVDINTGEIVLDCGLNFVGNGDQHIYMSEIYISNLNIDKAGGNVYFDQGGLLLITASINFWSDVVNIGSAVHGNLILNSGAVALTPGIAYNTQAFNPSTQIPPHIITNGLTDATADNPNGLIVIDEEGEEGGLNGTVTLPTGASAYSFNPVTITDNSGNYAWTVHVGDVLSTTCTGNGFDVNAAVQNLYQVQPLTVEDGFPVSNIPAGADISVSFNIANVNHDVLPDFNAENNPLRFWAAGANDCYSSMNGAVESSSGNFVEVSQSGLTNFAQYSFAVSSQEQQADSVVVSTAGNINPEITVPAGALDLVATVYPLTADQSVIWSVAPVTGNATITNAGVMTAVADGTVYAKAVSTIDPTRSDSLLVTISNQDVGIEGMAAVWGLKMYPNPAKDVLYFSATQKHDALQLTITDAFGRVIRSRTFQANELSIPQAVSLSHLEAGVYFAQLSSGIHRTSWKFTKR